MEAAQIFSLMNLLILPGWLLLLLAPRWQWTHRLVMTGLYSAMYALVYVGLLAMALPEARLDFGSLESVASLLQQPWMLGGLGTLSGFRSIRRRLDIEGQPGTGTPPPVDVAHPLPDVLFGPLGLCPVYG